MGLAPQPPSHGPQGRTKVPDHGARGKGRDHEAGPWGRGPTHGLVSDLDSVLEVEANVIVLRESARRSIFQADSVTGEATWRKQAPEMTDTCYDFVILEPAATYDNLDTWMW